jgi:hypothetical protein
MDKFLTFMSSIKTVFRQVTETGFVFIGFIVLVYLLLGEQSGGFVTGVIANLAVMVNVITPTVLGAIGLGIALLYLTKRK